MRVYNHTNKCGHRNPTRGEVEKRFAEIEALYIKRAKKLGVTFTADDNSYHLVIDYMFYGENGIDSLVFGHFREIHEFEHSIYSLAIASTAE
mmetsp:Transcript_4626/g.6229  ORF Transcript_4626/g.6229 Transcript_4626/m.6229 type:complete len:92 (-) Transcript_4626:920-1195(-)